MKRIKIKRIFAADFRKSARTLYDEVRTDKRLFAGNPSADEAYVFISATGNQIMFIIGCHDVVNRRGTRFQSERQLLDYRVWRIEGSEFNPLLLENYANQVGLTLSRQRFEEWYADRKLSDG